MKFISDIIKSKDITVSFEIFPPKLDAPLGPVMDTAKELSKYNPDFISVTYGAGGGTSANTVKIASFVENELNTTALSHLTCVSSTKEEIAKVIEELKANQIYNVLALRGDLPSDGNFPNPGHYNYAYQLVEELKKSGDFCIGAACYPEGHPESHSKREDIENLKRKVECGCDFLITQLFFDNSVLYGFLYNLLSKGIEIPVMAGIMPVTNAKQIKRMTKLSGASLNSELNILIDKFGDKPEAMKQAGIAYAVNQIIDLIANGVKGIHIYTMNKADIAEEIMRSISSIIKG
ncbi:MAG TPA: methylenetetrahydrofolate reductase [NAD(P)H] [Clostridiales bacterium]|nr:methylenetetrahydrofolate reductase [NAD(P)H] [Clostridiales bacterium]HOL79288.1 methylenetetrahydrofolate reductase [NAD(P)H] [Clostridiales bacterium]HPP68197.1 methylenetetrahydrofolate reductase [NAD(P)H] [Clostridiales bacterium]